MRRYVFGCILALFMASGALAQAPRIDVVFLLDSTGSMGDEIDVVKKKIQEMISEIALGDPAPDVRFGIVTYRDRGDEYVARKFDLTRDIDRIIADLDGIEANGGGDYEESVNEGLHVAIQEMNWDLDRATTKLVFLIGDAPPHMDYPDDYDYQREIPVALDRWIIVHAFGASGLSEEGERIFREIAEGSEGTFTWLTYRSQYVDAEGDTVMVTVSGRETTFAKGDSTWTAEDGGVWGGVGVRGGPEGGEKAYDVAAGGAGAPSAVENDLGDLITDTIKREAEKAGVEYGSSTSVKPETWGRIKRDMK